MPDTASRIYGPALLTAASATLYTVPGATTATLRNIHVANTTGSTARLFLGIGADAAGTRIWSNVPIPAYDSLDWSGYLVLAAAETLRGHSDTASALAITVSAVLTT